MLKGTVEDLLANRLEINVNVITNARSLVVTVETIDGVPTSYSYQILEPEEYKKEINNIKENTYTFDKLKIDTEYKIKVIVKNKVGLTKEITRIVSTEKVEGIKLELNPKDEYIKEGTVTITYPKLDNVTYRYKWDEEDFNVVSEQTITIPAKNGTLKVEIVDGEEKILTNTMTINNIDNENPTISKIDVSGTSISNVIAKVTASDQGISNIGEYSCDGTWQSSNTCNFKTIGNHTIKVKDKAGNESEEKTITYAENPPTKQHEGVKKILYYNPVTGNYCDKINVVSTTETKTGCMKWYAYQETSDTYTAILDHTTTAVTSWNSKGLNTDNSEIMNKLKMDTSNWVEGLNIRLISADEIAKIVDPNNTTNFNSKTSHFEDFISFAIVSGDAKCAESNNCKYAWLYDRISNDCLTWGCLNKSEGTTSYAYWTSTPIFETTNKVWYVDRGGLLHGNFAADVSLTDWVGIRPVITINKN